MTRKNEAVDRRRHPDEAVCSTCEARGFNMCSVLGDQELQDLSQLATCLDLKVGTTLIEEGMPADELFNVTSGTLKLYRLLADGRCQITGFAIAGDFIGLERGGTYLYAAEAITPVTLCRFRRSQLMEHIAARPHMEHQLLQMRARELLDAQDQMVLLGRKTARERIASFLLTLSARAVLHGRPGNPIALPMTRGEIADHLGLTTETVSRTLTLLKRDGVITLSGNHQAEVLDFDLLIEAAGEDPTDHPLTACVRASFA